MKAAQTNGRHWIGIDQSDEAIKAITTKLDTVEGDLFVSKSDYKLLTEKKHSSQQRVYEMGAEVVNQRAELLTNSSGKLTVPASKSPTS